MDSTELYAAALEIQILSFITAKQARRGLEQRLHAHAPRVSGIQYGVMRLLGHHAYTLSELSRKMMLDPATLVPVVDTLERHGYARRSKDPSDRRRAPIVLTERGTELLARVPPLDPGDAFIESLTMLGGEACAQLRTLLRELVRHIGDGETLLHEVESVVQIACDALAAHAAADEPGTPDAPARSRQRASQQADPDQPGTA